MRRDRRRNTRMAMRTPVLIFADDSDDDPIPGRLRDVSLGGLFIHTDEPMPGGQTVRLEVVLYAPGDPINIWLEGDVVRQESAGFAVQITGFFQESFARLRDLLLYGGEEASASLSAPPAW